MNKIFKNIFTFITISILLLLLLFSLGVIKESAQKGIWYIMRSSGLAAYVLLFFIIVFGIGIYTKLIYKFLKSEIVFLLHKNLAISFCALMIVHIFAVVFDKFLNLSLADIFIPFVSKFEKINIGIGIIGFYFLLAIIISSFFFRIKAPKLWRFFHYFSYPAFFLVFLHGVAIGTDSSSAPILYMYLITGGIVLILTLCRIAYPHFIKEYKCAIKNIYEISGGSVILDLILADGGNFFKFKPGQHIGLALYDEKDNLGRKHYFSIASSPTEKNILRLGIRVAGEFTKNISKMKIGNRLVVYGPYGDFIFNEKKMDDVVFIAGGIGITPFMSAIEYAAANNLSNKLTLIYSNRTIDKAVFLEELNSFARKNNNFKPFFAITEEKAPSGFEQGMVDEPMLRRILDNNFKGKHFFICGPALFMEAIIGYLKNCGVSDSRIRIEYF